MKASIAVVFSFIFTLGLRSADKVEKPNSTYVRFHIDSVPASGKLNLRASFQLHHPPWGASTNFGDKELSAKSHDFTKIGPTPWYRLQDVENFSRFGTAQVSMNLQVSGHAEGSTEFAVGKPPPVTITNREFPPDGLGPSGKDLLDDLSGRAPKKPDGPPEPLALRIVRKISWNVPDGKKYSLSTDLSRVETLRDHARRNYRRALEATGERLFPLMRPPMLTTPAWSRSIGPAGDYMKKTLRLLGFNAVDTRDSVKSARLYGWTTTGAQYWPPTFLPHDVDAARERYDAHYKARVPSALSKSATAPDVVTTVFQVADEPGEIQTEELSTPAFRFRKGKDGIVEFVDESGEGILRTKRNDYADYVLEARIAASEGKLTFQAGLSDKDPKVGFFWTVGKLRRDAPENVAGGKIGTGGSRYVRNVANLSDKPRLFRLVHDGSEAAMYLDEKSIGTLKDLPVSGGFSISGPRKRFLSLALRPIKKVERLRPVLSADGPARKDVFADVADDLLLEEPVPDPKKDEPKDLRASIETNWLIDGGSEEARKGFRKWLAERKVSPSLFGAESLDEVSPLTLARLAETPEEKRLYYWSRRYSAWRTPRMFALACEAIGKVSPNPDLRRFVALSGHSLYFPSRMPLDMFELASYPDVTPGVSDWMSTGSWRWDSHQAVAFSVAPFNSGARRRGGTPANFPMMHCVWPDVLRSYAQLGNNCKLISFYNYGPYYAATEGMWSESSGSHRAAHLLNNRLSQADDLVGEGILRPSRVAMLYSRSTEYWNPAATFPDKRASFLGLSHEYFQPELVTEEQVAAGDLDHYDALYVLETHVSRAASDRILSWTKRGGLLWTCADSFLRDEYDAPKDFLAQHFGLKRAFAENPANPSVRPSGGISSVMPVHKIKIAQPLRALAWEEAQVLATYEDGPGAWLEKNFHDGRVVYVGHRAGLDYTRKAIRLGGMRTIWPDCPRAFLTRSLHQRKVVRELTVSEPIVLAHALSSPGGDVIVLANMRADELENLEVRLRSPAKPISVQTFDEDGDLVGIPFTHADGVLLFRVPRLPSFLSGWNEIGQLYFVRSKPAPPDDRLDKLREQTEIELDSDDPETVAVAVWRAGFFPDWKLAGKLSRLLTHEDWRVRRASAESLGRLAPDGAESAIVGAFTKETDNHAKADQLHALARLGSDKFEAFHKLLTASPDPFLHEEAGLAKQRLQPAITSNVLSEEPYAKAIASRSPELLRKVFQNRAKLNSGQLTRLLAHLPAAYPVRYGNDLKAWADYFSNLPN